MTSIIDSLWSKGLICTCGQCNKAPLRVSPLGIFLFFVWTTVYPKKYAHGFCFAVLCCGYTLTDFPISITLTSLALWQSNDCPSASKATLMNMDKYSREFIMNDCITTTKQSTTKPCAYFLGYTVWVTSFGSCLYFTGATTEHVWV